MRFRERCSWAMSVVFLLPAIPTTMTQIGLFFVASGALDREDDVVVVVLASAVEAEAEAPVAVTKGGGSGGEEV